jgi:hypothetical protein
MPGDETRGVDLVHAVDADQQDVAHARPIVVAALIIVIAIATLIAAAQLQVGRDDRAAIALARRGPAPDPTTTEQEHQGQRKTFSDFHDDVLRRKKWLRRRVSQRDRAECAVGATFSWRMRAFVTGGTLGRHVKGDTGRVCLRWQ